MRNMEAAGGGLLTSLLLGTLKSVKCVLIDI